MSDSWRVTLPCTRADAERLRSDIPAFLALPTPPVLVSSEGEPDRPDLWQLDAYFEHSPTAADISVLREMVSLPGKPRIEKVGDEDWVTLSQQGLEPIRAGRFFVHTPEHPGPVPHDATGLKIGAGRAFGTGHHETTTGCLLALDRLERSGRRFQAIADVGTGTGLLAFAALRLWPFARITASDVDPVAIEVTAANATTNAITLGRGRGQVAVAIAAGLDHRILRARAPYDLIIANILAGPLLELSSSLAAALQPGGHLVLAGLLDHQAEQVAAAYRRQGLRDSFRIVRGNWPTLVLRKRIHIVTRARIRRTRDDGEWSMI